MYRYLVTLSWSFSKILIVRPYISKSIIKLNFLIWWISTSTKSNTEESSLTSLYHGIPSCIFQENTLEELDLSYQAIRSIPDEFRTFLNLKRLIINNCILLVSITPELSKLPLTYLGIDNCVSLKTPPPEIQRRGLHAIMTYLQGLSSGSVACQRTKLMLVGLGEAGKTSLLNALRSKGENTSLDVQVTDGINIKDWEIQLGVDGTEADNKLTYSMWDFAGQSVYYNTHQFFLTSRAVYILVW